jgi:3',5'-cyclic-AMP phosphodiesterase
MKIAHLSDMHLDQRDLPLARFRRVLDAVRQVPSVDAMVITGDVADHADPAEYAAFRAALPTDLPVLVTTGNHDVRAAFEQHIGPRNSFLDLPGLRIVGLDSLVNGEDPGLLDAETLDFGRAAIAEAPGSVVLALHHPPVPIGHAPMDATQLSNAGALAELAISSSIIAGILTGHVHTPHVARFAGVPLIGAPGIVSTLRIDDESRISADGHAPPGFAVHVLRDGELASRFVALASRPE